MNVIVFVYICIHVYVYVYKLGHVFMFTCVYECMRVYV